MGNLTEMNSTESWKKTLTINLYNYKYEKLYTYIQLYMYPST